MDVSLFTREWIEMPLTVVISTVTMSPSLRGSGLKFQRWSCWPLPPSSPSLRGSGLKCHIPLFYQLLLAVSLFTREWIEIIWLPRSLNCCSESPSLRGSGLKFHLRQCRHDFLESPSLRGSGLKWKDGTIRLDRNGLPLYEGVDWNSNAKLKQLETHCVSLFTREWIEISSSSR